MNATAKSWLPLLLPAGLSGVVYFLFSTSDWKKSDPEFHVATALAEAGDYVGALDRLVALLATDPNNKEVREAIRQIGDTLKKQDLTPGMEKTAPAAGEARQRRPSAHPETAEGSVAPLRPEQIRTAWQRAKNNLQEQHFLLAWTDLMWIAQNAPPDSPDQQEATRLLASLPDHIDRKIAPWSSWSRYSYQEGWRLYRQGEWKKAAAHWKEAVRTHPNDWEIQTLLAMAQKQFDTQEWQQTVQRFERAAALAERQGNLTEAVDLWKKAVALDSQNVQFAERLKALETRAFLTEQIGHARKDIAQNKTQEAVKRLTDVLQVTPQNQEALALLRDLEKQKPAPPPSAPMAKAAPPTPSAPMSEEEIKLSELVQANAYYNRGLMFYAREQLAEAEAAFEKAAAFNPSLDKAKRALARVQAELSARAKTQ